MTSAYRSAMMCTLPVLGPQYLYIDGADVLNKSFMLNNLCYITDDASKQLCTQKHLTLGCLKLLNNRQLLFKCYFRYSANMQFLKWQWLEVRWNQTDINEWRTLCCQAKSIIFHQHFFLQSINPLHQWSGVFVLTYPSLCLKCLKARFRTSCTKTSGTGWRGICDVNRGIISLIRGIDGLHSSLFAPIHYPPCRSEAKDNLATVSRDRLGSECCLVLDIFNLDTLSVGSWYRAICLFM